MRITIDHCAPIAGPPALTREPCRLAFGHGNPPLEVRSTFSFCTATDIYSVRRSSMNSKGVVRISPPKKA
jgi:hypothetical protein